MLQKRAVQAVTNSSFSAHSSPSSSQLGMLDIYEVNSPHIAKFMFCYHNQLLPPLFFNLFVSSNQIHNYNIRSARNYRPYACRTNLKKISILCQGPKIWNHLPTQIRDSPSPYSFKKSMMEFLLN